METEETGNLCNLLEITSIIYEDKRISLYNSSFLIQEYQKIIDASNLEGRLQISIGWLLIYLYISCNFLFVLIAINKEYPNYECIAYDAFENELGDHFVEYDPDQFKLIERCNDSRAIECIKRFCDVDSVRVADINGNTHNKDSVLKTFPISLLLKPPDDLSDNSNKPVEIHQENNVKEERLNRDYKLNLNFNLDLNTFPAILIDIKSIKNFLTEFYTDKNLCELEAFSTDILRIILLGKILGTISLYFITKFVGRKHSIFIITIILIVTNINFAFISKRIDYLMIILFLYSICQYIEEISYVYSIESMTTQLANSVNSRKVILNSLINMIHVSLMMVFKNWKILFYVNLIFVASSGYLMFLYNTETPNFLLSIKNYRRLRKNLTLISKFNSTYEFNVDEMLMKMQKQKRFSTKMLNINEEMKKDFMKLRENYQMAIANETNKVSFWRNFTSKYCSYVKLKNFIMEFHKNVLGFFVYLFKADSTVRIFINMIPICVLNSSIFVFYYGQIFYIERIKLSLFSKVLFKKGETPVYHSQFNANLDAEFITYDNTEINDNNYKSKGNIFITEELFRLLSYPYLLIFLLFFSEFLAEIISIKFNFRKKNKKLFLMFGFFINCGLSKIISMDFDLSSYLRICFLFLNNFFLMLNYSCIRYLIEDISKRRFFAGAKMLDIKTCLSLMNSFTMYFCCYYLFVTYDNVFFLFSIIFCFDAVMSFLFLKVN